MHLISLTLRAQELNKHTPTFAVTRGCDLFSTTRRETVYEIFAVRDLDFIVPIIKHTMPTTILASSWRGMAEGKNERRG